MGVRDRTERILQTMDIKTWNDEKVSANTFLMLSDPKVVAS